MTGLVLWLRSLAFNIGWYAASAILAIAGSVFIFVRYRESRRELEELRKGGPGGG